MLNETKDKILIEHMKTLSVTELLNIIKEKKQEIVYQQWIIDEATKLLKTFN